MSQPWQSDARRVANHIRTRVLELCLEKNGTYLSQALSSAEILGALYVKVLHLAPLAKPLYTPMFTGTPGSHNPSPSGGRFHGEPGALYDRFLISPAHYAVGIYAALEAVGRLDRSAFMTFNEDGSTLEMIGAEHSPGFELTTGSFGQALSQACGIAQARKVKGESGRTFVFISDGELEEGQTWEAAQAAAFFKLDKVHVFVDVNGQQYDGNTKDVMNIEPIDARFKAFGWNVHRVDGHDVEAIAGTAEMEPNGKPTVTLCDTNTTQGIPYLDSRKPHLHYVRPKSEADVIALKEALVNFKKGIA